MNLNYDPKNGLKKNDLPIVSQKTDLYKVQHTAIHNGNVLEAIKNNRETLNNLHIQTEENMKNTRSKKKIQISSKHNMFRFAPSHNVFLLKYKIKSEQYKSMGHL